MPCLGHERCYNQDCGAGVTSEETDKATRQAQTNFDDLQNELAGREVGRVRRFLPGEDIGPDGVKKDKGLEVELLALSALEKMMQDPEYAALYERVSDLLSRAEEATQAALDEAETELNGANEAMDETMAGANRLPDGTAVFKDKDGTIRTEDGRIVEGEEAEGIVWKDKAPSYEEYLARKQAVEETRRRIEELRRYQVEVLGRARDRMNDHDNPPTPEELRKMQRDIIERADPEVRSEVEPEIPADDSKAVSRDVSLDVKSPPI